MPFWHCHINSSEIQVLLSYIHLCMSLVHVQFSSTSNQLIDKSTLNKLPQLKYKTDNPNENNSPKMPPALAHQNSPQPQSPPPNADSPSSSS